MPTTTPTSQPTRRDAEGRRAPRARRPPTAGCADGERVTGSPSRREHVPDVRHREVGGARQHAGARRSRRRRPGPSSLYTSQISTTRERCRRGPSPSRGERRAAAPATGATRGSPRAGRRARGIRRPRPSSRSVERPSCLRRDVLGERRDHRLAVDPQRLLLVVVLEVAGELVDAERRRAASSFAMCSLGGAEHAEPVDDLVGHEAGVARCRPGRARCSRSPRGP